MKNRIIRLAIFILIAACLVGCSTPYMINRRRDAADIFTATLGIGLGAKVRVGPANVGLFIGNDLMGHRGGDSLTGHC